MWHPLREFIRSMSHPTFRKILECASPVALRHVLSPRQKRQRAAALRDAGAPAKSPLLPFAFALAMTLLFATGCATMTPNTYLPHLANTFPADGLVTQRGVLTVHGRQFAVNGYVALSPTGGVRVIMTESFGQVLADVLLKPDGTAYLMRRGSLLRPAWIKRYMVADLKCLFGKTSQADCPGRMINPTHFIIERPAYTLDLHTVETKPGPQPAAMFDASKGIAP